MATPRPDTTRLGALVHVAASDRLRCVHGAKWATRRCGALDEFLDHGEPPALVTLGSNAAAALPDVFVAAAQALNCRGVRGVLLTSTDAITEYVRERVDPSNAVQPFAPLDPVLRRCRAVVHAGGLGTLASTLHAGLPSAIRPAVTDQIWHAQRCEVLGVGVRARRNIGMAVHRVLDDATLAQRAARLGDLIRSDDGPRAAAELIEGS